MKGFILCVVCLQLVVGYVSADTDGVGVFAYQDSTGNRYGGTYGLRDGQVVDRKGTFPPDFWPPTFQDFDDFFPDYFRNLENVLQEVHPYYPPPNFIEPSFIRRPYLSNSIFDRTFKSIVDQNLAYDAARKAFDLTSNQAGYIPNFASSRFQNPFMNFGGFGGPNNMPGPQGFPGFNGFQMPEFGRSADVNSAFASAAIGPQFSEQRAEISPANPTNPNVYKVNRVASGGPRDYKSVSSSSYVSSAVGPDGKTTATRRAQTTVNDNGDVKTYKVES